MLTRTKRAELGYAIDSMFYGIPPYNEYLKTQLAKLTLADVNRVIKQYIRTDRMVIAAVTKNGEELKKELASDDASPMTYNSPKPQEITDEDKLVIKWPLGLKPEDIKVTPVARYFSNGSQTGAAGNSRGRQSDSGAIALHQDGGGHLRGDREYRAADEVRRGVQRGVGPLPDARGRQR